jgi:tetratricopeptide (TPR) repeat protein
MWRTASVLVVILTASLSHAQGISPWIGQRVVTRVLTPLKIGNRIVDEGTMFRVYTVERANGDWLWLVAGGVSGWVQSSEVVPYDQATDYFTLEIRANPSSAYLYVIRGMHWTEKGETDNALADFNEAIRLDPNDPVAFFNRGNAWSAKKESDKAIQDYNEAIRLAPRFAGVFYSRGKTWQNKQEHGKAIADYSEVIRRNPKFSLALNNRGNAWAARKEFDKAIEDYNEAIRLFPKDTLAFNNRGNAWGHKREFEKAIADYNEVIQLEPSFAVAFNNRGNAWSAKKEYLKAIADYDEAIRLDPKFALALNNRAWLLATCPDASLRDGKKAVQLAIRACELSEWKGKFAISTLAASYAEAGDFDKAVVFQEKVNSLYTAPEDRKQGEERLRLYRERKPYRQTG